MECEHKDFMVEADVNRISREEGGEIYRYQADIRIKCTQCGHPFRFIGLPMGMDFNGAAVSANGQEGRFAIYPAGEAMPDQRGDDPAGFRILNHAPGARP